MSEPLISAIAGKIAAYEHARQHGHVSEQASAALSLLRTTTRHLLVSDHHHNRDVARRILDAIDGEASE